MGNVHGIHASSQNVVLDIEAELAYWRTCHAKKPLQPSGAPFEACVATLKFGYDAYLLYHRDDLELLLPALKERYAHRLQPEQRLDWSRAQSLIRATWQRMRTCRSVAHEAPSTAPAANEDPARGVKHSCNARAAVAS